jgi:hypothetical protein
MKVYSVYSAISMTNIISPISQLAHIAMRAATVAPILLITVKLVTRDIFSKMKRHVNHVMTNA